QRVRVALRSVTDNRDLFSLNQRQVRGIVVIEICHSCPLELRIFYFVGDCKTVSFSGVLAIAVGGRSKSLPRVMAILPVRAVSRTPNGRSTSSNPSILSTVPETSRISDSGATSTTRARKTLINSIR